MYICIHTYIYIYISIVLKVLVLSGLIWLNGVADQPLENSPWNCNCQLESKRMGVWDVYLSGYKDFMYIHKYLYIRILCILTITSYIYMYVSFPSCMYTHVHISIYMFIEYTYSDGVFPCLPPVHPIVPNSFLQPKNGENWGGLSLSLRQRRPAGDDSPFQRYPNGITSTDIDTHQGWLIFTQYQIASKICQKKLPVNKVLKTVWKF